MSWVQKVTIGVATAAALTASSLLVPTRHSKPSRESLTADDNFRAASIHQIFIKDGTFPAGDKLREFSRAASYAEADVNAAEDIKELRNILDGKAQTTPNHLQLLVRSITVQVSEAYTLCYPVFKQHKPEVVKLINEAYNYYEKNLLPPGSDGRETANGLYIMSCREKIESLKDKPMTDMDYVMAKVNQQIMLGKFIDNAPKTGLQR